MAGVGGALVPLAVLAAASLRASSAGRVFMGELQFDQYYYLACARALFERGNGFAYPNPFDEDPGAPTIYSHLYAVLVGWMWRLTPLGLLQADYVVRVVAGCAIAVGLWCLITVLFAEPWQRRAVFWIAFLGGGCVWLEALRRMLVAGEAWSWSAFSEGCATADIARGFWFQNVFRNYFYATESLYHALAFWLLYALASRRHWLASILFALLLYAHPFTGAQFAVIVTLWVFGEQLSPGRRIPAGPVAVMVAGVAAFLFYNGVWLPSFPQHAALVDVWRRAGVYADPLKYLWVYGPWLFLLPPALWFTRAAWCRPGPWRLVVIELGVTGALMHNHWILGRTRPLQPLHFSHGYEFLPMVLLIMAWLLGSEAASGRFAAATRRLASATGLVAVVALLALDNLVFPFRVFKVSSMFDLAPQEAAVVTQLAAMRPARCVLTSRWYVSYFVATFTPHRTVLGHPAMTPDFDARWADVQQWVRQRTDLLERHPCINLIVLSTEEGQRLEARGDVGSDDLVWQGEGIRFYRRGTAP